MKRIHALAGCLWIALVGASAFGQDAGAFPDPGQTDPTLRTDRFGLFVGINTYAAHPKIPNLKGCVYDANELHGFFLHGYGFTRSLVLLDERATKSGIENAFAALLEQVRLAVRAGKSRPIHVLITYSGHGSYVGEAGTGDEADWSDSTWVPHDGEPAEARRRETHIVDDWIGQQIDTLIDLGATVLLISDSCHSGTISRSEDEDQPRGFGDAPKGGSPERVIAAPRAGLVVISACRDVEKAYETRIGGLPKQGRLSYAVRSALTELAGSGGFTYGDIEKKVTDKFQWIFSQRSRVQHPRFLFAAQYRDQPFLEAARANEERGSIVLGSRKGDEVEINLGLVHGSFQGARVEFHRSVAAVREGYSPVAKGEVVEAGAVTSRVRLDSRGAFKVSSAVARLVSLPRLQDFLVYVDSGAPVEIVSHLTKRAEEGGIRRATSSQKVECDLWIRLDDEANELVLSGPGGRTGRPKGPRIPLGDPVQAVKVLDASLTYLGRLKRLMALQSPEDLLQVQLLGSDGKPAERIREGENYRLRVTNRSPYPLHVYIFAVVRPETGPERQLALPTLLYPDPESGAHAPALAPRQRLRALESISWISEKLTDVPGPEHVHYLAVGQVAEEETRYAWVHQEPWAGAARSGQKKEAPPSAYFTVGRLQMIVEPAPSASSNSPGQGDR